MKYLVIVMFLFPLACSSMSKVLDTGNDTYMVTAERGNLLDMQADTLKAANEHCAKDGKTANVIETSQNPGVGTTHVGSYYQTKFRCLEKTAQNK